MPRKQYRRKVEVIIHDDQGRVLTTKHPEYGFHNFPGGGIEDGHSINDTVRKESLEELGYQVGNIRTIPGSRPAKWDWDDKTKDHMRTKGPKGIERADRYDGSLSYWRSAQLGNKDMSVYDIEGDAQRDAEFRPISEVIKDTEAYGAKRPEDAAINEAKINALRNLQRQLDKNNGIKEASKLTSRARNQISEGNFALPGRRYPIHDISHARNALAMVAAHGTEAEKQQVRAAVKAKYPSMGKEAASLKQVLDGISRGTDKLWSPITKMEQSVANYAATRPRLARFLQDTSGVVTGMGHTAHFYPNPDFATATVLGASKMIPAKMILRETKASPFVSETLPEALTYMEREYPMATQAVMGTHIPEPIYNAGRNIMSMLGKTAQDKEAELSDAQKRLLLAGGGGVLAGGAALLARKGIRRDAGARLSAFLSGKNARQAEMTGSSFPPEVIATADDIIKNLRSQGLDPAKVRIGVSGTPGTGKTTLSRAIAERVGATHRKIKGSKHTKQLTNEPVKPGEIIDQTHLFTNTKPDDHFDVMIHLERPLDSIRKSTLDRKRGAAQLDLFDYNKLHKDIRNAFDYTDGNTTLITDKFSQGGMRVRVKTAPTGGFKSDQALQQGLASKGINSSGMNRQTMLKKLRGGYGNAGTYSSYIDPGVAMSTLGATAMGATAGYRAPELFGKEAAFRLRGLDNMRQGFQEMDPKKKRYLAGVAGMGVGVGALAMAKPGYRKQVKNILQGLKQPKGKLDPKLQKEVSTTADRIIKEIQSAGLDPAKVRIGIGASGGTGKSTLAREIAKKTGGKHIDMDLLSPAIKMKHEAYLKANPLKPGEIADQSHLFSQANPDHFDVLIHLERDPKIIKKDLIKREYGAFQAEAYDFNKLTGDIRNGFDYNAGTTKLIRDDYATGGSRVRVKIKGKNGFQSEQQIDAALRAKGINPAGKSRMKKLSLLREKKKFMDRFTPAGHPLSYYKGTEVAQLGGSAAAGGAAGMVGYDYMLNKQADHVTDRAMERTNLTKREVHELRQSIQKVKGLEKGKTYHVEVPDRGYVVVGDVGKKRKKHVAKTVLAPYMSPPGEKLELDTAEVVSRGKSMSKESAEKLYRPRVDAIVHKEIDGKPHVLVVKADYMPHGSSRYSFPGGGIDPGQNANQAAQMELREEAGVRGKNFKTYGKATKLDLDREWRERQFKKRGELWHGIDNQVVVGKYDKDDKSLHGTQGDAWQFGWEPADVVEKELRRDQSQYAQSNRVAADALRDLRVKEYGMKAAYLSSLSKRKK